MPRTLSGFALATVLALQLPLVHALDKPKAKADSGQKVNVSGFSFQVEAAPAWVVAVADGSSAGLPKAPLRYVLIDEQERVDGRSSTNYSHVARVVDEAAGLAVGAQIQLVFDPSYQTLVLHKVEIVRDGHRLNRLDRKKVQLLQRETQLEARMYDGRVTASLVLDDVRVGDRIEYSYSIRGDNPVFEGKANGDGWLGSFKGPTALSTYRLLTPEERHIAVRAAPGIAATTTVQNGWRDQRFRLEALPQSQYDGQAPAIVMLDERVQYSEFADWAAVRAWGEHLFAAPAGTAKVVQQRADAIRASAATPEQQVLAALTFVQTEIRYFGTEIGENSHLPAPPATVLEQRFGDCKDKVALLVALLKALNIEAAPVLVSTTYQGDIARLLPGPQAFNHAIARVTLGGKVYWLDATREHQTGALAYRQSVNLGKGLVLDGAATALADLPGYAEQERMSVTDVFHMAAMADDPILDSRITYTGEMAEMLRGALTSMPISQFETQLVADYARLYPTLRTSKPIRIEEDAEHDAVSVVQQFTVPGFWRLPEQRALTGEVALWALAQAVQTPNDPMRKLPYRLQLPGVYRHTVALEFPEDLYSAADTKRYSLNDPHFDYALTYNVTPRRAAVSAVLKITSDRVEVADWNAYNAKLTTLRPHLASSVTVPPMRPAQALALQTQMRALADGMAKGTADVKATSREQVVARLRVAMLTAQLDGGFLNPRLRAEVLQRRAENRDHLGQSALAQADFEEAMRLVPDNAETIASAAINAFLRGDYPRARVLGKRALELAPADAAPHSNLGMVNYADADYRAAEQDWLALLADGAHREAVYPAIWLALSARRNGEDGVAAVQPYLPTSSAPAWPYPVLQWFNGAGDLQQAVKVAVEDPRDKSRLCELYFFAGEKFLLDGDKKMAREYFQRSVDTGIVEFVEYQMAKRELAKLPL